MCECRCTCGCTLTEEHNYTIFNILLCVDIGTSMCHRSIIYWKYINLIVLIFAGLNSSFK